MQADTTNAGEKLLANPKTTADFQRKISDENTVFEHRCALEHSQHFKDEAKKARRACNKLILTAIVSAIFCGTEAVGGTISGSLAILCDAAHQLSDVAGFVISFLAIYLTRKPATLKHTYGYHRADVIGALGSIMIIWGLLIWLLIEAVHRLINPSEIDGELMLIIACFGLGCNITNLVILTCCCNETDEEGEKLNLFESIASAYKPYHGNQISNKIKTAKLKSRQGSFISQQSRKSQADDGAEMDRDLETPKLAKREALLDSQQSAAKINRTLTKTASTETPEASGKKAGVEEIVPEEPTNLKRSDAGMPIVEEVKEVKRGEQENLNVRAAIVHMMGDMVQSAGVIVAAVIIYIKPEWTIADPICTFLFSILVMFTTVPIFKDCMRFLMESAPECVDTVELYNSIQSMEMVTEIHDFHCWELGDGKPIFTAHIVVTGNPSYALYNITQLLKIDYEIYHSTLQIEPVKKSHIDSQRTNLLQCVNEHNFQQDDQQVPTSD